MVVKAMPNETELIKKLRDKTSAGVLNCRSALKEADWDLEKAIDILRKKGVQLASKRGFRTAKAGKVESYIHAGGKIGVMVEVNCETDFVARTDEFQRFARDIAMQIAATSAQSVGREEIPEELIEREKAIYREGIQGKPPQVIEKIVEGKLSKFFQETCLLEQSFVKNDKIIVRDLLTEMIAKTGENIVIRRFQKFILGDS